MTLFIAFRDLHPTRSPAGSYVLWGEHLHLCLRWLYEGWCAVLVSRHEINSHDWSFYKCASSSLSLFLSLLSFLPSLHLYLSFSHSFLSIQHRMAQNWMQSPTGVYFTTIYKPDTCLLGPIPIKMSVGATGMEDRRANQLLSWEPQRPLFTERKLSPILTKLPWEMSFDSGGIRKWAFFSCSFLIPDRNQRTSNLLPITKPYPLICISS